jgi:hypothetical protein
MGWMLSLLRKRGLPLESKISDRNDVYLFNSGGAQTFISQSKSRPPAFGGKGGRNGGAYREKARRYSWPHSPHRTRAKPLSRSPNNADSGKLRSTYREGVEPIGPLKTPLIHLLKILGMILNTLIIYGILRGRGG